MSLFEKIPEDVENEIFLKIGKKEEIKMALGIDIDFSGNFVDGWLVFTTDYLVTVYDYRQKIVIEHLYKLAPMSAFKVKKNHANLHLEARVNDRVVKLARFTVSLKSAYLMAEKYMNRLARKEKVTQLPRLENRACPECGRNYPDSSKVCPLCLHKWKVVLRLTRMLKPHLKLFILTMIIFWTLSAFSLVHPQLQRILINDVLKNPEGTLQSLVRIIALMGGIQLITMVLNIIRGRMMTLMSNRIDRDIKNDIYYKIQDLSLGYLTQSKVGDLMNRITGDSRSIQGFLQHHAGYVINQVLIFIGVFIILLMTQWRLALVVVLPIPLVLFINRLAFKKIRRMYMKQWRLWDRANSLLQDILSGIRVVKAFGREKYEVNRFTEASRDLKDITVSNEKNWSTIFPSLGFIVGVGNFLIYYIGGHYILNQEINIGELIQFTSYAAMIYQPLMYLTHVPRWFNHAMTAAERIFDVIDQQSEINEKEDPVQLETIKGKIKIEKVSFAYKEQETVLKNINLEVEPGEMIGLVGHSGAGKTTLINLICRFYDVDQGAILIDSVDIRDMSRINLRSQIGVVLQETFLFNDTIGTNIAYAKPEASYEEIIQAAKLANAHEFIIKFTDGYDTVVGEKGQRLSGGERQRIAIARALLHNPRILILDEPTSAVDTETEEKIQEALERLIKDRTTFAIAHRLGTLRNASRLMVMDKGKKVELGTHEELMKKRSVYFKLVMAQKEMQKSKAVGG